MEENNMVRFAPYAHKMMLQAAVDRCLRELESGTVDDCLKILTVTLDLTRDADFYIQDPDVLLPLFLEEANKIEELMFGSCE